MTDIEKLIELLYESDLVCNKTLCEECDYLCSKRCKASMTADYLLANGVRLEPKQATSDENKRWIPVTERLPENDTAVIVATDNGMVFQCLYAYDGWDLWDGYTVNITHWMPLPEPPKEERDAGT